MIYTFTKNKEEEHPQIVLFGTHHREQKEVNQVQSPKPWALSINVASQETSPPNSAITLPKSPAGDVLSFNGAGDTGFAG